METTNPQNSKPGEAHVFRISREFNAPRKLVFEAFTQEKHMANWWGPAGVSIEIKKLDLRPGGVFHYLMKAPDGSAMWGKQVYREIAAPERLVFVNSFSDEHEGITHHPMAPDWPAEMLCTIIFTEQNGKTLLSLSSIPIHSTTSENEAFREGHSSMQQGFGGTFDQLEAYLSTIR